MLDFTKITFNEIDGTYVPLQIFYGYDLNKQEIKNFLDIYATAEEVPEDVSIQKIELLLSAYAKHDFKLEACCIDSDNNQYWVEINFRFANAVKFIRLLPDCAKGILKSNNIIQQKETVSYEKIECNSYV